MSWPSAPVALGQRDQSAGEEGGKSRSAKWMKKLKASKKMRKQTI